MAVGKGPKFGIKIMLIMKKSLVIAILIGIDTMTEEMQKNEGDIRQSLMNYNKGDSKEEYADFIINVANKTEPITLE